MTKRYLLAALLGATAGAVAAIKLAPVDEAVAEQAGKAIVEAEESTKKDLGWLHARQRGRWTFRGLVGETDDPEHVARQVVIEGYASGEHPVLVVGLEGAFEYVITLNTREVTGDAG